MEQTLNGPSMDEIYLKEYVKSILPVIERYAVNTYYGSVCVDDPRNFRPDPECATPEEIAAWQEACKLVNIGENVEIPMHFIEPISDEIVMHSGNNFWGLGLNIDVDEEMLEIYQKLCQAIGITPRNLVNEARAQAEQSARYIENEMGKFKTVCPLCQEKDADLIVIDGINHTRCGNPYCNSFGFIMRNRE